MKNDQNRNWKVYTHTTPNGDVYVGVTCQTYLSQRWHPSLYQRTALKEHIDKCGWDAIKHEVIYTTTDREEAYQVEEEMRQYYEEKGCCINKQRSGLIQVKDEKAYMSQYYKDHKEERNERSRQWQKDHKEEQAAYQSRWEQDHKEERNAYHRQLRAKKKAEKELTRMAEADLKRIKDDQTISLMNEIIQFRQLMKKIS